MAATAGNGLMRRAARRQPAGAARLHRRTDVAPLASLTWTPAGEFRKIIRSLPGEGDAKAVTTIEGREMKWLRLALALLTLAAPPLLLAGCGDRDRGKNRDQKEKDRPRSVPDKAAHLAQPPDEART